MNNNFKRNKIALAVISTLALNSSLLIAEELNPEDSTLEDIEIIRVTGYISSQKRALQDKRNASSIIDSIASEDLGKFPDQNISESLQRIPGITISRKGGEGQFITVRGMGPEHSTVLLNGRVLATENEGREFSFDIIPSELISSVDVYKTPTASLQDGGIASTVNLKTARPLDYDGFKGAVSVKALYDDSSEKTTPQFSGLLSDTFYDGTVGLLGSLNYYKREFRTERSFTDGYEAHRDLDFDNDGIAELTDVSFPSYYTQDVDQSVRERVSGTIALQWQATDNLLLTLDSLYSKLDVNSDSHGIAWWVGDSMVTDATVDENNTVNYFKSAAGARPTEFVSFSRPRFAETKQIGFNADWVVNEQLSLVFDTSYSKSTDKVAGNQSYFVGYFENPDREITMNKYDGDTLPTYSNIGDLTDLSTVKPGWFTYEGRDITDEASQATFDANYELNSDILTSVQAGVSYSRREKSKDVAKTPDNISCIYCSWTGHEYDGFMPESLVSGFDGNGFLSGESGGSIGAWPTWDNDELVDFMLSDAGLAGIRDPEQRAQAIADIQANGGFGVQPKLGQSGSVLEQTLSAYFLANFEGELGELPWSGNLGLRYSKTDITSSGTSQVIESFEEIDGVNEVLVNFSDPVAISESGDYDIWLPTSNFKLNIQDDLVMRLAAGKTITRPTLSNLLLDRNYNTRPTERNVSSGNPGLKPMTAWNYDISFSWYMDDVSYVSAAIFHKDLTDKWERKTQTIQIEGYDFLSTRPENVSKGEIDGFELAFQYTFNHLPAPFDGLGLQTNYTDVTETTDEEDFESKSQSANLVAFYEKGPLQARISYNYRDGYTESLNANRGQPKMISDYGQWDASASYDLTDNFSLFVEAINITNERTKSFSIYEERLIELKDTGSRFTLGARYNF
ncbi:TonB-dependent receptor [Shewanella sp.]|uniref:TonB-dependent receptor n=1 Tax=Shewanella sp. TaxID=50422 RepID=UPI001ECCACD1|nr:TonB-dependent receptor [Shewanella sp.]NRB23389.1 TonB-dependent receptor [Shewanella sp.]